MMTLEQLLERVDKYKSLELATSSLSHRHKAHGIMLGDDGRYWVATLGVCEKLASMGYEWA